MAQDLYLLRGIYWAWLSFLAEYIGGNNLLWLLGSFMTGWRFDYGAVQKLAGWGTVAGMMGRERDLT